MSWRDRGLIGRWNTRLLSTTLRCNARHPNVGIRVDGLVQERRNSSALAMELRLSCTNSSMYPNKHIRNKGVILRKTTLRCGSTLPTRCISFSMLGYVSPVESMQILLTPVNQKRDRHCRCFGDVGTRRPVFSPYGKCITAGVTLNQTHTHTHTHIYIYTFKRPRWYIDYMAAIWQSIQYFSRQCNCFRSLVLVSDPFRTKP